MIVPSLRPPAPYGSRATRARSRTCPSTHSSRTSKARLLARRHAFLPCKLRRSLTWDHQFLWTPRGDASTWQACRFAHAGLDARGVRLRLPGRRPAASGNGLQRRRETGRGCPVRGREHAHALPGDRDAGANDTVQRKAERAPRPSVVDNPVPWKSLVRVPLGLGPSSTDNDAGPPAHRVDAQ
jgi:hypothetical protein